MSSLTLLVSLNNFEIRNAPLKPGSKTKGKNYCKTCFCNALQLGISEEKKYAIED
jgi:hypothetical protein